MDMIDFFKKGGPIMWPLLAASLMALTVVIERLFFMASEKIRCNPKVVEKILFHVQSGDMKQAIQAGKDSRDSVARVLLYGLEHDEEAMSNALMRAASRELKRYDRGLAVLDTIITLAPLLGLLGTVTGMIHAFGLLGNQELGSPAAITGGIAEALIATAFGLGVAITALLPFNYLNARLDEIRHSIEDACTHLEIYTRRMKDYENFHSV